MWFQVWGEKTQLYMWHFLPKVYLQMMLVKWLLCFHKRSCDTNFLLGACNLCLSTRRIVSQSKMDIYSFCGKQIGSWSAWTRFYRLHANTRGELPLCLRLGSHRTDPDLPGSVRWLPSDVSKGSLVRGLPSTCACITSRASGQPC